MEDGLAGNEWSERVLNEEHTNLELRKKSIIFLFGE